MSTGRKKIVCVGAHPDDVDFGAGGTCLMLCGDYDIHYVILTSGQAGIKGKAPEEAAAVREAEQRRACEMIGAELTLMRQMDGDLYADRDLCGKVGELLKKLDPTAVFTMWPIDVRDHSAAYEVTQKALHHAGLYYTVELYMYETSLGGQTNRFVPDIYVNISDVMDRKMALLKCHASQTGVAEGSSARQQNRFHGMEARVEYAEVFKTPHALIGTRWERRSRYLLLDL